ncbi:hypothetical protein [Patiriisocius sp. Uisw_017]|uniref:hypothetical protein n=1 Tax=Patiriisocius sp. Uisw_017 TaxID=3230968 RepID=UPI0039E939C2
MIKIIHKTLFFSVISGILYLVFLVAIVAIMLLLGTFDLRDFIPKKETVDAISYIASSVINWTS